MEPSLPKDCFCCSLRTGCIIIGVLLSSAGFIYYIATLVHILIYEHEHMNSHAMWPDITYYVFTTLLVEYGAALQSVFSFLLVYGIITDKSHFTLSWLVCQVSCGISYIVDFVFSNVLHSSGGFEYVVSFIILCVSMVAVYSYYQDQPKKSIMNGI